jgi:DNA-binding response OmpR family regulator
VKILWLDDQPETVRGTEAALRFDGHEVSVVADSATALSLLRETSVDLLIVDEWLDSKGTPEYSGSELIADVRAGVAGAANVGTPFVVATADHNWVDVVGLEGRAGYLGKVDKSAALTPTLRSLTERLISVSGLIGPDGLALDAQSDSRQDLIVAFKRVSAAALAELAARPQLTQQLHWRDFEVLLAQLFEDDGFEVVLTGPSGDRGVDFYAARRAGLGSLLYVVECKRFRADRPVKPGLVRELRGVVDREQANCGVLVTSSYFDEGAHEEQRTTPHRIALRDLRHIAGWLRGEPIMGWSEPSYLPRINVWC